MSRNPVAEFTTNKETALFLSRVEDLAAQCQKHGSPAFLGFLDTAQQALAGNKLKYSPVSFCFWGGCEGAERVFLGLFPQGNCNMESFPIRCLEFVWKQDCVLSHRDFLGSFMALQLKREVVGDICVEPGRCVAFFTRHGADAVLSDVSKIGRVGVTVSESSPGTETPAKSFLPITGTAASLRLDCIVAFLGNLSRSSAAKLISAGQAAINGIAQCAGDKTIAEGDKISIRGIGKFIFDGQDGVSRKDKLRLKFRKYQ